MKIFAHLAALIAALAIASAGAAPIDALPNSGPTFVGSVRAKILEFRLGHAAGLGRIEDYRIITTIQPDKKFGCKGVSEKLQRLASALGLPSFSQPSSSVQTSGPSMHNSLPHSGETLPPSPFVGPLNPNVVQYFRVALHNHHKNQPFMNRLDRAIRSLGKWESRAVAFVFGCGIGSLIRILFMFCLLIVRAWRNRSHRCLGTAEETAILLPVEPPAYVDEKATLHETMAHDPRLSEESLNLVETVGVNENVPSPPDQCGRPAPADQFN
ncbi:uncharacterized protein EI90DRAFT_3070083 [Cantharellus anzutake]|uniref:uncharacterized protein n=1 Tax=Cantharellus anzutake TaxID=1750568 RepID=UPI001907CBFE|nr:uncharacterized protein EI90DRAFT_3070083 [Cantharellus anzutake]KAF8326659.1 hypothetical protein EI90DRAFT_3070083 [Cantharellus anzutake]